MKKHSGYLEVIAGPMFSGKTEELIRQVKRAKIGRKKIQVFKHSVDTRYGKDQKLYSHAGMTFESELLTTAAAILKKTKKNTEIIAIDEGQWFGKELVGVVETLVSSGKKVIISGLALTYDREPFEPMPTLMAMADKVTKLSAICAICGDEAVFHKRVGRDVAVDPQISDPRLVGKLDAYQARCRNCFNKK